jgi:hypothetical protein
MRSLTTSAVVSERILTRGFPAGRVPGSFGMGGFGAGNVTNRVDGVR